MANKTTKKKIEYTEEQILLIEQACVENGQTEIRQRLTAQLSRTGLTSRQIQDGVANYRKRKFRHLLKKQTPKMVWTKERIALVHMLQEDYARPDCDWAYRYSLRQHCANIFCCRSMCLTKKFKGVFDFNKYPKKKPHAQPSQESNIFALDISDDSDCSTESQNFANELDEDTITELYDSLLSQKPVPDIAGNFIQHQDTLSQKSGINQETFMPDEQRNMEPLDLINAADCNDILYFEHAVDTHEDSVLNHMYSLLDNDTFELHPYD